MLVTSEINMSSKDIYNAYHQLWQIEESFRIMKSELDTRPVYLQKENRIKGHFFICYTAVLLSRILQFKILENKYSASKVVFAAPLCTRLIRSLPELATALSNIR